MSSSAFRLSKADREVTAQAGGAEQSGNVESLFGPTKENADLAKARGRSESMRPPPERNTLFQEYENNAMFPPPKVEFKGKVKMKSTKRTDVENIESINPLPA